VKLFITGSIDVVHECRSYFEIELPRCLIKKKTRHVLSLYNCVENLFCRYCIVSCDSFVLRCSEKIFSHCLISFVYPLLIVSKLIYKLRYVTNEMSTPLSVALMPLLTGKVFGLRCVIYPYNVLYVVKCLRSFVLSLFCLTTVNHHLLTKHSSTAVQHM